MKCFCCGEPIDGRVALVTLRQEPCDMVFLMKVEHVERANAGGNPDSVQHEVYERSDGRHSAHH